MPLQGTICGQGPVPIARLAQGLACVCWILKKYLLTERRKAQATFDKLCDPRSLHVLSEESCQNPPQPRDVVQTGLLCGEY